MNHKLEGLKSLVSMLRDHGVSRLKSMKKPTVAIHIEKTEDESPEDSMLHSKMDSAMDPESDEHELSIQGDDVSGRRSMMKKLIK